MAAINQEEHEAEKSIQAEFDHACLSLMLFTPEQLEYLRKEIDRWLESDDQTTSDER